MINKSLSYFNQLRVIKVNNGLIFHTVSTDIGDIKLEILYSRGQEGRFFGPPEDCFESEPDEVEIESATIDGLEFSPLEDLEQELFEKVEDYLDTLKFRQKYAL